MKRLILGLVMLGMCLSGASVLAIAAEVEQKDEYGNIVYTKEGHYVKYIKTPDGYTKVEIDKNYNTILKKVISSTGYNAQDSQEVQKLNLIEASNTSAQHLDSIAVSSAADQQNSDYLTLEKRIATLGSGIGASNLLISDINNDGKLEIICGGNSLHHFGGDDFWYVLSFSAKDNNYFQSWVSDYYSVDVKKILIDDIDNNGSDEIIIALENGNIEIYDALQLTKINAIGTIASDLRNFVIGDIDNDGEKEFVLSDFTHINNTYVYSASDYSLECIIPYGVRGELEIGNVDDDPALEIVIGRDPSSNKGYVIDGITHAVEWEYNSFGGFGRSVELADIDNDGRAEIIATDGWYNVCAYDVDTRTIIWNEDLSDGDIADIKIFDIDGNNSLELLIGDGQWGYIRCYGLEDLTEMWKIRNPEHGVTDINFGDVDNDGMNEVLWGAGYSSTGPDYLYVGDIGVAVIEWQSIDESGPFNAFDIDDVDNDGKDEIVMCSFESEAGYDDGIISIYDAENKLLEWQWGPLDAHSWTGVHDLNLDDIDTDGVKEIIIATSKIRDGLILVYDGITHGLEWQTPVPRDYWGMPFSAIGVGDVDDDGVKELIAGNKAEHASAEGRFVFAFDISAGLEKWRTMDLVSDVLDVEISDLDNNNQMEIITLVGQKRKGAYNRLYVLNGVDGSIIWESLGFAYTCLDIEDFNNDGIKDIIMGTHGGGIITTEGEIIVYSGDTYSEIYRKILMEEGIEAIKIIDSGNDYKNVIFTANKHAYVYDLSKDATLWSSPNISSSLYKIMYLDIDSDDKKELLFGSRYALHIYERNNKKPQSFIDSIIPNPADEGEEVVLVGHGEDEDGDVVDYNWRSSINGDLGNTSTLLISTLSIGTHTILFKVKDNDNAWSDEVSQQIVIEPGEKGAIYGKVLGRNRPWWKRRPKWVPLEAATIKVRGKRTGVVKAVQTDENGNYRIENLPQDLYKIKASKDGYRTRTKGIFLKKDKQKKVIFKLK